MILKINNKKPLWIWTKWITSWYFEFNYIDIESINKLPDLFKIKVSDLEFNCIVNTDSLAPIVIETETIKYNCKVGQGKAWLNWVRKSYIKLDIYIDDDLCGILRGNQIEVLWKN